MLTTRMARTLALNILSNSLTMLGNSLKERWREKASAVQATPVKPKPAPQPPALNALKAATQPDPTLPPALAKALATLQDAINTAPPVLTPDDGYNLSETAQYAWRAYLDTETRFEGEPSPAFLKVTYYLNYTAHLLNRPISLAVNEGEHIDHLRYAKETLDFALKMSNFFIEKKRYPRNGEELGAAIRSPNCNSGFVLYLGDIACAKYYNNFSQPLPRPRPPRLPTPK